MKFGYSLDDFELAEQLCEGVADAAARFNGRPVHGESRFDGTHGLEETVIFVGLHPRTRTLVPQVTEAGNPLIASPRVETLHFGDEAHERPLDRHARGVSGWFSQQRGQFLIRKAHLDAGDNRFPVLRT